jgi:hypothetical protein
VDCVPWQELREEDQWFRVTQLSPAQVLPVSEPLRSTQRPLVADVLCAVEHHNLRPQGLAQVLDGFGLARAWGLRLTNG